MQAPTFLATLDKAIEHLVAPLDEVERQCGWSDESKASFGKLLTQMRADFLAGNELAPIPAYRGLVRGMDHWGIGRGKLFEELAAICVASAKL